MNFPDQAALMNAIRLTDLYDNSIGGRDSVNFPVVWNTFHTLLLALSTVALPAGGSLCSSVIVIPWWWDSHSQVYMVLSVRNTMQFLLLCCNRNESNLHKCFCITHSLFFIMYACTLMCFFLCTAGYYKTLPYLSLQQ